MSEVERKLEVEGLGFDALDVRLPHLGQLASSSNCKSLTEQRTLVGADEV